MRRFTLLTLLISGSLHAEVTLPPLDTVPEADLSPTIEWKEDWSKSFQENSERWKRELESEPEKELRDRRLEARQIALLRGAREKWPAAKDDPRVTLMIADRLGYIGAPAHRAAELQALVESRPGDVATAAEALQKIAQVDPWSAMSLPAGTMEYAIDRLAVLEQGGALPPGDLAVGRAYLTLAELRRLQGRHSEAWLAVEEAESRLGRTVDLLWTAARTSLDMGLRDRAVAYYEELERTTTDRREAERARGEMKGRLEVWSPTTPRPTVRIDQGLARRWELLRDAEGVPDAAAVTRLLDDPGAVGAAVRTEGDRYGSLWAALVSRIETRFPELATSLGEASEAAAADAVTLASTDSDLLVAYRKFPWSAPMHAAMIAAGERALWDGDYGGASRWFDDVRRRARTPELRELARVGYWLALAQSGDVAALEAALASDWQASGSYPWRGGKTSGRELADMLRKSAAAMAPKRTKSLARETHVLPVPMVAAWAPMLAGGEEHQRRGVLPVYPQPIVDEQGRMFLSGPGFAAGYDATGTLRWSRTSALLDGVPGDPDSVMVSVAPMRPVVTGDVVITRGAPAAETAAPTALLAFDATSGLPRWTSQASADWDGLVPASDAVCVDGWGYVIAMNEGVFSTAHVIAFDPSTGQVRWRRALASQTASIQLGGNRALNPARYGSAPVVVGGALYASTQLGIVAKLDVRDGAIEWMSLYDRGSIDREGLPLVRSLGGTPVVHGDRVVLATRDRPGLFAFDTATGAVAWERPTAPSRGIAGAIGTNVIAYDDRIVAGIDIASGVSQWHHVSERVLESPPQVVGDSVGVLDGGTLILLDAATGLEVDRRDWTAQHPVAFAMSDSAIALVSRNSAGMAAGSGEMITRDGVVRMERRAPLVIVPPKVNDVVLVRSGDVLEAVEPSPQPRVRWRRRLPIADASIEWLRDGALLRGVQDVELVRLRDGATVWRAQLPWPVTMVAADEAGVAVASFPEGSQAAPRLALLDSTTGKMKWERTIVNDARRLRVGAIGFHGGSLHAIGGDESQQRPPRRIVYDLATGGRRSTSPLDERDSRGIRGMGLVNGYAWVARDNGELTVATPEGAVTVAKLDGYVNRHRLGWWVSNDGGTICLMQRWYDWQIRRNREAAWLVPLEAPARVRRMTRADIGVTAGRIVSIRDTNAATHPLGSEDETPLVLASGRGESQPIACGFDPSGERVALLVEDTMSPQTAYTHVQARIDVHDARGARIASAPIVGDTVGNAVAQGVMDARPARERRVVWLDNSIVVTTRDAVHFLPVPREVREAPAPPVVAYRADAVVVDGDFAEWDDVPAWPLGGDHAEGTVRARHDGKNAYFAVAHPQAVPAPLLAPAPNGLGSWLELGVAPNRWSDWRCGLGLNARGEPVWFSLDGDPTPSDATSAIRFDRAAGELRYEFSIPLDHLTRRHNNTWLVSGLTIAAWQSGDGADSPKRLSTGGGLGRPTVNTTSLPPMEFESVPK